VGQLVVDDTMVPNSQCDLLGRRMVLSHTPIFTGEVVACVFLALSGCQVNNNTAAFPPPREIVGAGTAVRDAIDSYHWPGDCFWLQSVGTMLAAGSAREAAETMEAAILDQPSLVDAGLILARAYTQRGCRDRAVDWLGRLAAANPTSDRVVKALVQGLIKEASDMGSPSGKLPVSPKDVLSDVGWSPVLDWVVVGFIHQMLGRMDKARAAYAVADSHADSPGLRGITRRTEAAAFLMNGDKLSARRALDREGVGESGDPLGSILRSIALDETVDDADIMVMSSVVPEWTARLFVGWLLVFNGRREDAMPLFQRVAELKPRLPGLSGMVGAWLYEEGRYGEAIPLLSEAIRQETNDAALPLALLWARIHAGKIDEAIPTLEEYVKADPNSNVFRFLLGAAYAVKSQERKELIPKALEHREAARHLGNRALAAYSRFLAVAYLKAGEPGKALCEYGEAVDRGLAVSWEKELAPAMKLLAAAYRRGASQPKRMVTALRQVADAYPDKPLAHFVLSLAYLAEDAFDEALEEVLLTELLISRGKDPPSPGIAALRRSCESPDAAAKRAKQRYQRISDSARNERGPSTREEADVP